MLEYKDYVSNLPDFTYVNFIDWLERISKEHADCDAVLYRSGKQKEFTRWTYARFGDECRRVARGLLASGLVKGDRVAIWSENRPEWMIVWVGTIIAGLCVVPVDFLISEQECLNIIKLTGTKAFFYSGKKKDFAASLLSNGISLNVSVCLSHDIDDTSHTQDTEYYQFGAGTDNQTLPSTDSISPDDPVSIIFTSGTTGFAKGVTLSHKNILANSNAAVRQLFPIKGDVFLSVLPLHHTYPTTCAFISPLSIGVPIVMSEKIVGKVIVDDVRDGGVTYLIAVPLLYDKVMAALDSNLKKLNPIIRGPINLLRNISLKQARKGNPEFGRKMLKFIRKKAGLQSIKMLVAGGGPLRPTTADFFDSLGFNIVQGYGMSENSPLITVNTPRYKINESVGLPVIHTEIKIIDPTPEGVGEIACRSPSVMLGYFENEEATKEVITEDGWLLTGDLGFIDDDGFIHIRGRKKNLIVGSGGKNIYPEEVEAHFHGSRTISEVLIVGRKDPG